MTDPLTRLFVLSMVGALATVLGAWWVIRRAEGLGLIDLPGQRRMHQVPTPRGGGIGMVAALVLILGLSVPGMLLPATLTSVLAALMTFLATVGFWDDRRGLPVLPRLAAHLGCSMVMAGALFVWVPGVPLWSLAVVPILFAASINLANFLDGLNGILSIQFTFVMLALVLLLPAQSSLLPIALAAGIAVLVFLPFNFPVARCFMGDAASGTLGFFLAVVLVLAVLRGDLSVPAAIMLPSALLLDTTLTLLSRIVRGKKFWRAHREHLYQWWARSGRSVWFVNGAFLCWNVFSAVLAWWFIDHELQLARQWLVMAVFLLIGSLLWWNIRHWILRQLRERPY
ncbi:MAG: hypothetical protein IPK97_16225 [Ahniella sp.]|nr:hypothetical protein [Ahniella sp.]